MIVHSGEAIPPDWSQFWPDLLGGFITSGVLALVVGLVLWRAQHRAEARRRTEDAEASWSMARGKVRVALNAELMSPDRKHVASLDIRKRLASVVELIDVLPVATWAAAAPKNQELQELKALAVSLPDLFEAEEELQKHLTYSVPVIDTSYFGKKYETEQIVQRALLLLSDSEKGAEASIGLSEALAKMFKIEQDNEEFTRLARELSEQNSTKKRWDAYVAAYERTIGPHQRLIKLLAQPS